MTNIQPQPQELGNGFFAIKDSGGEVLAVYNHAHIITAKGRHSKVRSPTDAVARAIALANGEDVDISSTQRGEIITVYVEGKPVYSMDWDDGQECFYGVSLHNRMGSPVFTGYDYKEVYAKIAIEIAIKIKEGFVDTGHGMSWRKWGVELAKIVYQGEGKYRILTCAGDDRVYSDLAGAAMWWREGWMVLDESQSHSVIKHHGAEVGYITREAGQWVMFMPGIGLVPLDSHDDAERVARSLTGLDIYGIPF